MRPQIHIVFETAPYGISAESWWLQSAADAGMDARIYYSDRLNGIPPSRPDAVLMRCYDSTLSRAYEALGARVFNNTESMELCRDKFRTARLLEEHGIPTPRTLRCQPEVTAAELAAELGDPFIVKPNVGSKGDGVRLVYADSSERFTDDLIAQTFVPTSKGRDARLWTVENSVVAAVKRVNNGSVAANHAKGGIAIPLQGVDTESIYKMASKAAKACGLFFAGVDILFGSDNQYIVCELNGNAGFRTNSLLGGPDIPAAVMKAIAKALK